MAAMPSGREIYSVKVFVPPLLEPSALKGMRAPPDRADDYGSDSSDEEREEPEPVGAFPGTRDDYSAGSSGRNYY